MSLVPGPNRKLRIGVLGLGRAFTVMLPTLTQDSRVTLAAAADLRPEARARFGAEFSAKTYETAEALCADPAVDVIYIATPHQYHAAHALLAAKCRKHMLVEKPMALTLEECATMTEAARGAGVQLIVGHSHSFDAPIARTRALIDSGEFGKVRMITALNFTDYLYRPRRPEELDTAQGGGAIFNQAAHQIDIVRLLGGGRVKSVRAATGAWDQQRKTEGAYGALLTFENDVFATLTYNGYGHFDSDEFQGWTGEMGQRKTEGAYGALLTFENDVFATLAYNGYGHFDSDEFQGWTGEMGQRKTPNQTKKRLAFRDSAHEAAFKNDSNYGGTAYTAASTQGLAHQHFGTIIVSCQHADLRPHPNGVMIYQNGAVRLDRLAPPDVPRAAVIDELYDAIINHRAPLHDGPWAMATLEVCLAVLRSAREHRDITLAHQAAPR